MFSTDIYPGSVDAAVWIRQRNHDTLSGSGFKSPLDLAGSSDIRLQLKNPLSHLSEGNPAQPATAVKTRLSHRWSLPEVRIVLVYFILASTWIIGSDLWLVGATKDHDESVAIQMLKGLNFVITTAVLLFFVLRHSYSGWRHAEQQRVEGIDHARERFRNLSSHVQTLRENDRAEISREIHDELGQLLTGIQMQLRLIEDRLSDREDRTLNPLIDKLVETSELVDTTINSVQRISAGLRPSSLDNLGLATAGSARRSFFPSAPESCAMWKSATSPNISLPMSPPPHSGSSRSP